MKEYSNGDITVIWNPDKCIHARECIMGLPRVFRRGETPWIDMQAASSEEIKAVVDRCPSGALIYRKDQPSAEVGGSSPAAKITVKKNGPLLMEGGCQLRDSEGKVLAEEGPYALCRCGSSGKKPFCDGTHNKIGFDDTKDGKAKD